MINQQLIRKLVELENLVTPVLFKPKQFNIIKKLCNKEKLTDNEKRYLRGNMRKKLQILEKLEIKEIQDKYILFLNSLDSYYITGLEALKYNGYGWYFQPKIIEIINTKLQGKLILENKILKLIRLKSMKNDSFTIDKTTGLKYATNEQIIKDTGITKNDYTKKVWIQMIIRYKKMFVENYNKFKSLIPKPKITDYAKYGI